MIEYFTAIKEQQNRHEAQKNDEHLYIIRVASLPNFSPSRRQKLSMELFEEWTSQYKFQTCNWMLSLATYARIRIFLQCNLTRPYVFINCWKNGSSGFANLMPLQVATTQYLSCLMKSQMVSYFMLKNPGSWPQVTTTPSEHSLFPHDHHNANRKVKITVNKVKFFRVLS